VNGKKTPEIVKETPEVINGMTVVSTALAALCVGALGWIKVNLRARRDRVLCCISTVQCLAGDDAVDFWRKSAVFRQADGGDSPVRMFWKASSTLLASRAEVSMKDRLFSPEHFSLMVDVEEAGQHTCELFSLVRGHSSQVSQVALVSNKHDDNIRVSMISKLLQPSCHIVVCLVLADVVD
jgi:hypothetical protein